MSDVDAGFLEVLASCTDAEGEVDYSDDGWMPADGEYTVLLERFSTWTKEKGGIQNGCARAVFRLLTSDDTNRSFGEFFWLPSNPKATTMGMNNLLRLGTCLCGRELKVAEIPEACQHVVDNCGSALLNIRVVTTTSRSDNKTYTNAKYLGRVDEVEPPAAPETTKATA